MNTPNEFTNTLSTPARIVVIGGSGLIGRQVVSLLGEQGHEAIAASPSSGVNTLTGEGLAGALQGARVVVDVSNSPSFEDGAVLAFFQASTTRLVAASHAAGVQHYVALSVVGTDRLQAAGYFRAKLVQENLIKESGLPHTIVRVTQFFEFIGSIAHSSTVDDSVRLAPALLQPIAACDVALAVAGAAVANPLNGQLEVAGPEVKPMTEFVAEFLRAQGDARPVVADPAAGYFGTLVDDHSLVPGGVSRIGATLFRDWLARNARD